jgi:hypothetical protein
MAPILRMLFLIVTVLSGLLTYGQETVETGMVSRYLSAIDSKSRSLEAKLEKGQQQYLKKLEKAEQRLLKKLQKGKDSALAKAYAEDLKNQYGSLENRLANSKNGLQNYDAEIDSLRTNLGFIKDYLPGNKELLNKNMGSLQGLENQLQKNQYFEEFIGSRTESIKSLLGGQTASGLFNNELKQLNKVKYYYSSQLNEYRSYLTDRKKAERKLVSLFQKSPLYQQFAQKHSWFSQLFPTAGAEPGSIDLSQLGNLQTRDQLSSLLQSQLATGGENAIQAFQQQLGDAQQQVSRLQDRVSEGLGNGDPDFPSFKPNNQKNKSLFDRITLGFDIQNRRANEWFPITSDYGLSVGYKINDQSIVGIGASAKVGWGEDFRNIKISYQGYNVRSFLEYKLKGTFWIYGGYELNHRMPSAIAPESHSNDQPIASGLLGISKKIPVKSSFLKQTRVQLLYDFLNHHQYANRIPIVFRMSFGK